MTRIRSLLPLLLLFVTTGCSLTPDRPVTRSELLATRIYSAYTIEESPEEVLNALNTDGEAILAVKRTVRGKDFPMHLKLLATSDGLEVLEYDR